jgi:monoamine oxidase
VRAERPWDAPAGDELDLLAVEGWIRQQTDDPAARDVLAHLFETTTVSPRRLSLLSAVAFIASCCGLAGLETEADELFVGGAGRIPRLIADELGDRLRLAWPVETIAWAAAGVDVDGPRGLLSARHAIVAMSPFDAGRIDFQPGLPTKRGLLNKGWLPSSVIKTNVVYDAPFWHEPNGERPSLAGWATNDAGCPSVVLDATPADRAASASASGTTCSTSRARASGCCARP